MLDSSTKGRGLRHTRQGQTQIAYRISLVYYKTSCKGLIKINVPMELNLAWEHRTSEFILRKKKSTIDKRNAVYVKSN